MTLDRIFNRFYFCVHPRCPCSSGLLFLAFKESGNRREDNLNHPLLARLDLRQTLDSNLQTFGPTRAPLDGFLLERHLNDVHRFLPLHAAGFRRYFGDVAFRNTVFLVGIGEVLELYRLPDFQVANAFVGGGGMVLEIAADENDGIEVGEPLITVQEQTRITVDSEQAALERRIYELGRELDKTRSEYEFEISQLELDMQDMGTSKGTQKAALEGRIAQIKTQRNIAARSKKRVQDRLALAKKQFERTQKLFDSNDITITEYEAGQAGLNELEKDLGDASAEIAKINVSLSTAEGELAALLDERRAEKLQSELDQTFGRRDRDIKRLEAELTAQQAKLQSEDALVQGVSFEENLTFYKSNYKGIITDVLLQLVKPCLPSWRRTSVMPARKLRR